MTSFTNDMADMGIYPFPSLSFVILKSFHERTVYIVTHLTLLSSLFCATMSKFLYFLHSRRYYFPRIQYNIPGYTNILIFHPVKPDNRVLLLTHRGKQIFFSLKISSLPKILIGCYEKYL